MGAPSGHDGDAEAEEGTAASFDQLLRRAAAARAPQHDGQERGEEGSALGDAPAEDPTD